MLPRFDISYTPNKKCLAYATLSKGYRAGGYNFQMFSDAIRDQLQGEMIKAFIANADNAGMGSRIPESVRAMAQTNNTNIKKQISYKPEHSWNYEVGARSELVDRTLLVDVALFYIDVRDQQITSFAKEGMGRITKNAGKSRSFGLELGFKYYPVNNLAFYANYGCTDAKCKKNSEDVVESYKNDAGQTVKDTVTIDYKNKHIPFAPAHTMSVGINYLVPLNKNWIDNLNFNAGFSGAGRIYWTEDNSAYQNFYGTLNAKISARKGIVEVSIWGKNLTATSYQAFYFESLGNRFAQKGTPLTFGGELAIKF